jgi:hypothetical protein
MNKSYFECKRCFTTFYQKIDITRHLDKKNLCTRVIESYRYNDDDIRNMSFTRIYINNPDNINSNKCSDCGKILSNSRSLKQHLKLYCKKTFITTNTKTNITDDSNKTSEIKEQNDINNRNDTLNYTKNDTTINYKKDKYIDNELNRLVENNLNKNNNIVINGNNNTVNHTINNTVNHTINNINININITQPFDDIWDTSMIDNNKKIVLLLNSSKFTQTLEEILENEVNLNVLIDKTTGKGMIYNNDTFTDMSVKDIVKRTMSKLYKQLCVFHNDISNDIINLDKSILNNEIKTVEQKYRDFISNIKVENMVNEYISDIYAKKNNKTYNEYDLKNKIKNDNKYFVNDEELDIDGCVENTIINSDLKNNIIDTDGY